MSTTKADYINQLTVAINTAVSNTGPMTSTDVTNAFNAVMNVNYTVDPTKKGTIKQLQYE